MTNKHIKMLNITNCQRNKIITILAFLLTLVSMATLKKTNKSKMLAGKKWTKGNH